jgi:hypothetical protein
MFSPCDSDFLFMLGGIGCFLSSAITLLVCQRVRYLPASADTSKHLDILPSQHRDPDRYQVKPLASIPDSRPPSHYAFPQPMSPKSPVNFVQYHRRHQPEYPPLEVDYKSQHTTSRSRTRKDRNYRCLDFEVGIREDTSSSYSEAPPYHQYPEEDQWEDRSSGK